MYPPPSRGRPARRLHGAGNLERKLVKTALPGILRDAAFVHQAQQIAVSAEILEAMVVDAGVADMNRHQLDCACAADIEKLANARGIDCRMASRAGTLRPFRPAAAGVAAVDGEDGRTLRRLPGLFERVNFLRRKIEQPAQLARQRGRREVGTDLPCSGKLMVAPIAERAWIIRRPAVLGNAPGPSR